MSKRLPYQHRFSQDIARLALWAADQGYLVVEGESWRHPNTALLMEQEGKGIANSLHTICMAKDISLFLADEYLTRSEDYTAMGEKWESMGDDHNWGGRFKDKYGKPKPDGNHFSISYPHEGFEGVK